MLLRWLVGWWLVGGYLVASWLLAVLVAAVAFGLVVQEAVVGMTNAVHLRGSLSKMAGSLPSSSR